MVHRLGVFLFTFAFGFITQLHAQTTVDYGVMMGTPHYIGELSNNPLTPPSIAGGGIVRVNLTDRISWSTNALYAKLLGSDANSNNPQARARNLSFQNNIFELGTRAEINYFKYQDGDSYFWFSPFLFFGINYFRMNPKGTVGGQAFPLQSLGTEGQGASATANKPYQLNQIGIPFGIGLKLSLTKSFSIAFETGMRKTFTDYLDDVSSTYADPDLLLSQNGELAAELANQSGSPIIAGQQRGHPHTKDWYGFTGLSFLFRFGAPNDCDKIFNSF